MNRRRILALVSAAALVFFCFCASAAARELSVFGVSFSKGTLTSGKIEADVTIQRLGESEAAIVALGYYTNDGILNDFTTEICILDANPAYPSIVGASVTLSLDIPETLENGDYVRVAVMSRNELSPYTASGESRLYCEEFVPVETEYKGIYERYYTLDGADGSLAMDGGTLTVSAEGTPFRLKDMAEGYIAFVDSSSDGEKRRLSCSDGSLGRRLYGTGGASMLWRLTETDGGCYISHHDGGYLAIEEGKPVISDKPCKFTLTLVKESPFTLMTSLEGYKLLTDAEKTRVCEICTSVGACVFPDGTNRDSLLQTMEAEFADIYKNSASLTAERQKERILKAVSAPVRFNSGETNELNSAMIKNLPGGDAEIIQSAPTKETVYIWDLGTAEYNRIDVTYKTEAASQTVKVYYADPELDNVQTAISALARFPYEYRQYLKQINVYVPETGYTYNCDGTVLTVRVPKGTGVESMVRNFAHELGHSVDFCANGNSASASWHWCQGEKWTAAVAADIASVSVYGNSNAYEGFAEFARMYFQCFTSRDRQIGIKQLFPNRFASFGRLLDKIGMERLY